MIARLWIPITMLICFSYPVTTVLILLAGLPLGEFNQYIKASLLAATLGTLFLSISMSRKFNAELIPLIAFCFIYGIRLIYDVTGEGILMMYQTPVYVYGYFFGLTFLPIILLSVTYSESDLVGIFRWVLAILLAANVALLVHALTADSFAADTAFAGRVEVAGDLDQTAALNPLTFGLMGAMLSAMVIGFLTTAERISPAMRVGAVGLLAMGGANILFSASRGPAIAFALVLAVTVYTLMRGALGARTLKVRASTWVYLAMLTGGVIVLVLQSEMNIFLFDRFSIMYESRAGGGTEERDFLLSVAWSDFLSAPLFGNAYVLSIDAASPHSVLFESLMALGLFGTAFLAVALGYMAVAMWRLLHGARGEPGYALALAALCLMTMGLTSFSIGQSPELWIFIALITMLGRRRKAGAMPRRPSYNPPLPAYQSR